MPSPPIKVLFFVSLYEINGVCTVVKNLLDNLNKENYKLVLLTEKISERHYKLDKSIKIINLNINSQKGLIRKIFNYVNHLHNIKKYITSESPDVVISSGSQPNCHAILAMTGLTKKPKLVIIEHSDRFFIQYKLLEYKNRIAMFLYRLLIYFLYHRADQIIAVSQNISKYIRKLFFVKKEQVSTIHNPVNIIKIKELCHEKIEDMEFETDVAYIATVTRLSPEKNISLLIKAFSIVADKLDSRLLIIGEGEERDHLIGLSSQYNIKNKVIFAGYKKNPFKYLKKTDVFVLSSIYEGFPNVILESMACGIPVVSTLCSDGIREVIANGINGLLVEERSPSALADAILRILLDRGLKEKLIEESNNRIQEFDMYRVIKKYETAILKLPAVISLIMMLMLHLVVGPNG